MKSAVEICDRHVFEGLARNANLSGAKHPLKRDVVCRARHVVLWMSLRRGDSRVKNKSLAQPDGGEGCSGITTGYPATVPREEVALLRQGTANAWGDEQKPSQADLAGQARNTGLSPLSIIGQVGILGARVQKATCLPRGDPLRVLRIED